MPGTVPPDHHHADAGVVPPRPQRRSPWNTALVGLAGLSLIASLNTAIAPAAFAAPPVGGPAPTDLLGQRPGATALPIPVSDTVQASVDVGTGNLLLTLRGLALRGVNQDTTVGLSFNSLATPPAAGPSVVTPPRWNLAIAGTGVLSTDGPRINFHGADGSVSVFTPLTGSTTTFTAPPGVKADLVKTATGYTLTSRTTAQVVTFDADGKPTQSADRNNNATTLAYSSWKPTTVTATRGATEARTATLTYDSAGILTGFRQASGSSARQVILATDGAGDLTQVTDAAGKNTTFTYTDHRITSVSSPTGATTKFSYDASGRVTSITAVNTAPGVGNSITRLAYPDTTQSLVAGPNTDQGAAITTVPRTTYTLTSTKRVSQAVDALGRERATTYTGDFDTLTATRGTGPGAGTTTNAYGANSGQSLTSSQSPGGATSALDYANTAASTAYLPTSGTDDAGNTSLFTYSGSGNPLSSQDALAATATLTYNTDGTPATALAPGNGTNKSLYTYDSLKQLTKFTPVTGSSLGVRTFTYDLWGRTATATNGAGTTATYTYDALDRVRSITHSGGTANTTYTYNNNGQLATRTDPQGTTTYGYDQLGRLTSRANTAGGGTIAYGYDKASNLTSTTDTRGTTTYAFDASGVPSSMTYQYQGTPRVLAFGVDDRGRRTDTWMDTNPEHTIWAAHTRTRYDTTGRVTGVLAEEQSATAGLTTVVDLTYCYAAGSTAPTCPSNASTDRSKIQWTKDNKSGAVTAYTYDRAGRLTKAAITGGSSPATYTYTYDSRGNRLTATTTGSISGSQSFTVNAANQITTAGYGYDGAGNLTADPNGTYAYNAAQQMTTVTKGGATYHYTYAGGSQNELLSQTTPTGTYQLTYGRTDAQGMPVIEQLKKDNLTAYLEHDPVTGEPLMLRTASGKQALYVHDGTGSPVALITNEPYVAFAYAYDPYGTPVLT
ncbi:hypothetical protein, partial [Paeniglutamicibacter cryotolerans]